MFTNRCLKGCTGLCMHGIVLEQVLWLKPEDSVLENLLPVWKDKSKQSGQELLNTKKPATKLSQYKKFHSMVLYKGSSKLELRVLKEDNFWNKHNPSIWAVLSKKPNWDWCRQLGFEQILKIRHHTESTIISLSPSIHGMAEVNNYGLQAKAVYYYSHYWKSKGIKSS